MFIYITCKLPGVEQDNAHCVLLGPKYALKKLVCPARPILLMNPMHHPVTMAKNHVFLPIGVEGKAKTLFSAAPSLGCAHLGPIKALGTSQLVPH